MQVPIKKGVIAKVEEFLSTFILLSTSKLDLTFILTAEILKLENRNDIKLQIKN